MISEAEAIEKLNKAAWEEAQRLICRRKSRYVSLATAKEYAEYNAKKRKGPGYRAYHCHWCTHFHITSDRKPKK